MSRIQHKGVVLACQMWTLDGATQTATVRKMANANRTMCTTSEFNYVPRRLVNAHKTTAVGHASNDNTEPICENATGKKRTKRSSTHGFLRKCQPPAWQNFSVASKGKSVKDAVPGLQDGKGGGGGCENATKCKYHAGQNDYLNNSKIIFICNRT